MEFVKPYLKWKKKIIPFTTLEWSGTDNQASRQMSFEVPWNPYDEDFPKWNIKKGDVMELWFEGSDHAWLTGQVTSRDKTADIGTASYVVKDFMHHLLQSTGTYIFKNTTPEAITKKICKDVGIETVNLAKTGIKIKKIIFEDQCLYDIIIKVYRKVKAETKKNYIPYMLGNKLTVLEKGKPSGTTLTQGVNITSATYSDNIDSMVDLVKIYNDKHVKVGEVKNDKNLSTYGVYQRAYQKEDGTSAKKAAEAMLFGTTREAAIEALGDIRAMSGFSIKIKDPATGLEGKFFITSDTHTFQNNVHTMSLSLAWKDTMEEGADAWKKEAQSQAYTSSGGGGFSSGGGFTYGFDTTQLAKDAKEQANNQFAFYIDAVTGAGYMGQNVYAQTCYHSSSGCRIMKQEMKKYGVGSFGSKKIIELKKVRRIIKAPQTYGAAYKMCSCCWKSGKYGETVSAAAAVTQGSYASANQGVSTTPGINTRTDPRYS